MGFGAEVNMQPNGTVQSWGPMLRLTCNPPVPWALEGSEGDVWVISNRWVVWGCVRVIPIQPTGTGDFGGSKGHLEPTLVNLGSEGYPSSGSDFGE